MSKHNEPRERRSYMSESMYKNDPRCIRSDLADECRYLSWGVDYEHWCGKAGQSKKFAEDRATSYCRASIQCAKAMEPKCTDTTEITALKADLADAVGLLNYLHTSGGVCSESDAKQIAELIAKHKGV